MVTSIQGNLNSKNQIKQLTNIEDVNLVVNGVTSTKYLYHQLLTYLLM